MVATAETKPIRLYTPAKGIAKDAYGRTMSYLRISLTDRCNFRCVYCMPEMGMKFQPRDEILTDDELDSGRRRVRRTRLYQVPPDRRRADDPPASGGYRRGPSRAFPAWRRSR